MHFRTKDLLITVLPKAATPGGELAEVCLWETRICNSPTICVYRTCMVGGTGMCPQRTTLCGPDTCIRRTPGTGVFGCGFAHSCGPGGSACDPTVFCPGGSQDPWVINDLEDLAELRLELKETLE